MSGITDSPHICCRSVKRPTDDAIDDRVGFEADGRTLCIRDALEGEKFPLYFDREPQPQPALPDLFHVPVDRAVSFRGRIGLDPRVLVCLPP